MSTGSAQSSSETINDSAEAGRSALKSKRSPNYPYIDLQTAVSRAKLIHDRYDDHFVPGDTLAELWGMSKTSSSVGKILAAMSQFGLLDDKGYSNSKEYKLSDRALDILTYPQSSPEHAKALAEAALDPPMHAEVWSRFNKGNLLPSNDDLIRIYLVRQREDGLFNKAVVDGFIQQLRRTLTYAGVEGAAKIAPAEPLESPLKQPPSKERACVGDFVQWTNNGVDQFTEPRCVREIDLSGEWALVEGSNTGVPVSELSVVDPPPPKEPPAGSRKPSVPNPFQATPPKPQHNGPFISFPLTADNVVELRLSSRISKKDFDRFKKLIDLFEESLVEPETPAGSNMFADFDK